MKRIISIILVAILVLSLAACSGSSTTASTTASTAPTSSADESNEADYEYPVVTWKVAHACADGSPSDVGCEAFCQYIMEKSGGNITVEVYPAGQLGTDIAELESCQLGDLEFTSGSSFALQQVSAVDGCLMWDLPYFFQPFRCINNDDVKLIRDDPAFQSIFVDELLTKNIHYINQSANGNYVICGDKPYVTPEDFKGSKIRAAENSMLVEALEEWGAQPVVINMFELYTAIEQGTCDAAYVPDALLYQFGIQSACKYITILEGGLGPCYLSCADDFYQSQDPEVQKLIDEAGEEYCNASYDSYSEQLTQWLAAFEDAGAEVVWLTNDQKEVLRDAISETHAHWRELCGADLYDEAEAYNAKVLAGKNIEIPEYK